MTTPTNPWEWILTILLFIISLSVLITLHEVGHLSMAKLFNVYCLDFSIGFGPALLHKKKKGAETYFSIRAIPLGGYVSMYGEDVQLEEGLVIPKERSLEGIKRWKKAIIVSAGVIVNALLAFVLFFISNVCFPLISATSIATVTENSIAYNAGVKEKDRLYFVGGELEGSQKVVDNQEYTFTSRVYYEYEKDGTKYAGYFYIVDDDIAFNDKHYVMTYYPTGNKNNTIFSNAFKLYPADTSSTEDIKNSKAFELFRTFNYDLAYYPNYVEGYYKLIGEVSFNVDTYFREYLGTDEKGNDKWAKSEDKILKGMTIHSVNKDGSFVWEDVGLSFITQTVWLDFGTRMTNTFIDFGSASSAVFQGLSTLFTGGIQNMSGFIGIFQTSASIFSSYAFSTYLYFWGLISVNLAIFNLLPFPGLDGWQLVVTAVEGGVNAYHKAQYKKAKVSNPETKEPEEWKIPTKVKSIISIVGLALLFILMIVIVGFDIARLVS